ATGDIWQQVVDPNAGPFSPVNVKPGKTGTLEVTITPSGRKGRVVRGTLFVDNISEFLLFGNELLALPYEYTVGQPANPLRRRRWARSWRPRPSGGMIGA